MQSDLPPAFPSGAASPASPVPTPAPAPRDYRTAGAFLFAAGLTTGLCALLCIVLLFLCFCIGVLWIPCLAMAVITTVCGWRAMHGERVGNLRVVNALALVAALLCGDLIGLVLNVLALVWLSNFAVSSWIEGRDAVASSPHGS